MANKTVYPYGTNGRLPSSVGIINDLSTGGADKALSAEMGKYLNETIFGTESYPIPVDLSEYPLSNYVIASNNVWEDDTPGMSVFIPLDNGQTKVSIGSSGGASIVAFLRDNTKVDGQTPNFSTSIPARIQILNGETNVYDIPSDAAYLYATVRSQSDGSDISGRFSINWLVEQEGVVFKQDIVDNLDSNIPEKPLSAKQGNVLKGMIDGMKELNILVIGNSYSYDSFSYVPYIVRKNLPNARLNLAILYQGGASLQDHLSNIQNDTAYAGYAHYFADETQWTVESNSVSVADALALKDWDIITFQQASADSRDYSTYSTLGDLIDAVHGIVDYPVKFGWVMTPAWADGHSSLVGTSAQMYADIVDCVENLVKDYPVEAVFPYGTAIQNARGTSLDSLGTFGHLTYDGTHLAEGIPCLVAAYANFLEIVKLSGNDCRSIIGEQTRPDAAWISGQNIPGQHGSSVGVSDANCLLAQKCAVMASKFPMEVSTIR